MKEIICTREDCIYWEGNQCKENESTRLLITDNGCDSYTTKTGDELRWTIDILIHSKKFL